MAGTMVNRADRMMLSAVPLEEGIELTFADGQKGLIPITDLPEVAAAGGLARIELPNPYEIALVMANGEQTEIPWDFARHYCDGLYRPQVEVISRQGRKSLGSRLRELREAAGLTQERLAERSGIGRVTLVRIEQGEQSPRFKTLTALSGALGLPVDDILLSARRPAQSPRTPDGPTSNEIDTQRVYGTLELSAQQRAVLTALQSRDTEQFPLSRWYLGALSAWRNRQNPDRMSQAAHSLRELMEKLPRVLTGSDIQQVRTYDFKGMRRSLYERFQKDKERFAGGWRGNPIDSPLAGTLERLDTYLIRNQTPSRREQVQMAVVSIDPLAHQMDISIRDRKRDEIFSVWQQMEVFAHHNASEDDFDHWLHLLEVAMLDLLAPITAANQQEMQAIMRDPTRTPGEVQRMLGLIERRGANYIFFFSEVSDPSWIPVLREQGYFFHPPNVEDLGDGRITLPNWWPMRYLTRVAKMATPEVLEIIEEFPPFDNPRVYEGILDIALQLEGDDTGRLKTRLLEYAKMPNASLTFRLPDLLAHWTRESQTEAALELAKRLVYFAPDPEAEEKRVRRQENPEDWTTMLQPRPGLEEWDYLQLMEEGMRPLAEAAPYQVARILISAVNALMRYGMHPDQIEQAGDEDRSEWWHPNLMGPSGEVLRSSDALVGTMTLACERVWENDPASINNLDAYLRSQRWKIFKRLRQHLYALRPNQQSADWIRQEILSHQEYSQWQHGYEFQRMIRQACDILGNDLLSRDELTPILDAILDGPNRDSYRRFAGESYSEEIFQSQQRYFHRMQLHPFRALLFDGYLEYLDELEKDASNGVEDSDYRQVGEARSGMVKRRSPLTGEQLANLPDEELLEHINEWDDEHQDSEDWLLEVTIEALAEGFQAFFRDVIMADSDRLQFWLENRERIQRPIYVRAMLDAMRSALRDQDFGQLGLWFETCEWVLGHPDGEYALGLRAPDASRDNPYWGSSRRAVEDLMSDLLQSCHDNQVPLPAEALTWLPRLLDILLTQFDWALDEGQQVFLNRDDWVGEGINNTRSRAIQDLIRFGALLRRDDPDTDVATVIAGLKQRLNPEATFPMTLPERAILGVNYDTVCALDYGWAVANKSLIFPRDDVNAWATGFAAFLHFHRPYGKAFEFLRDDFQLAVQYFTALGDRGYAHAETADLLGNQLFRYYLGGQCPLLGEDSLVERYYEAIGDAPERRRHLLNHAGLLLYHTKGQLAPEIGDRFKDFFEWRLQAASAVELAGFEFWLQAACLDPAWRLGAFSRVLDVWRADAFPAWFNWASIVELLPEHTTQVVECFAKIAETHAVDSVHIFPESAKRILTAGLNSSEDAVQEETRRVREILLNSGRLNVAMLED